ncbi:hypothetical protein LCGC14_2251220, partial [marine sediment metagenome]
MPKKIEKKSLTLPWYSCLNVRVTSTYYHRRFGLGILSFVLAFISKESAITLVGG